MFNMQHKKMLQNGSKDLFILGKGCSMEAAAKQWPNYSKMMIYHATWDFSKVRLNSMKDYGNRDAYKAISLFSEKDKIQAVAVTIEPPIKNVREYLSGIIETLNKYGHGYHINLNGKFPYFEAYENYPDYRVVVPIFLAKEA